MKKDMYEYLGIPLPKIEDFDSIMQQHMMMIAIFKKFEKGGEA